VLICRRADASARNCHHRRVQNLNRRFYIFLSALLLLPLFLLTAVPPASADDFHFDPLTDLHPLRSDETEKRDRRRDRADLLERERDRAAEKADSSDKSDPADMLQHSSEKFDGSEFKAHSFIDTNFEKQSYRNLFSADEMTDKSTKDDDEMATGTQDDRDKDKDKLKPDARDRAKDRDDHDDDAKKLAHGKISNTLGELPGPVHELAGDWVPDKIDLTDNGGFELSPDNGSPVPYRLNGFPDLERNRP
jgi:hypothetical protein